MANRKTEMEVGVKDSASKEFQKIGQAAEKMGKDVESVGKKSTRSMDEMKRAATAIGAAIGVVGTAMSIAGREAYNHNTIVTALTARYRDQTDEILRFADTIQDTTNYTNDQALKSAQIFGSLIENYGISVQEVEQLIRVSADLATASGISLEDASIRIQSAIRGETEAAEYLGLALNANTIDREGLMLSMTNEEAAHFRLNALMQQSAYATGLATSAQTGATGAFKDLTADIQDQVVAFGNWLGPMGEVMAQLGPFAYALPLVSAGLGRLAAGFSLVSGSSTIAAASMTAARTALVGTLGILAGPVGLVALITAAAVAFEKFGKKGDGYTVADAYRDAAEGAEKLAAVQSELAKTSPIDFRYAEAGHEAVVWIQNTVAELHELSKAVDQGNESQLGYTTPEALGRIAELNELLGGTYEAIEDMATIESDIAKIYANNGPGRQQAIKDYQKLIDQWGQEKITAVELSEGIGEIANNLDGYNLAAAVTLQNTKDQTLAWNEEAAAMQKIIASYKDLDSYTASRTQNSQMGGQNLGGEHKDATLGENRQTAENWRGNNAEGYATQVAILNEKLRSGEITNLQYTKSFHGLASAQATSVQNARNLIEKETILNQLEKTYAQQQREDAAAQVRYQQNIMDAAEQSRVTQVSAMDALVRARENNTKIIQAERDAMAELKAQSDSLLNAYKLIPTTTQAFENGFRAIVSNTNAIAQNSQQVADWADNVIGAVGVAGKMDNIRYKINQTTKQALITEQDYAAAQAAYTPIMEANQRIQDATLAIQVKQAPVLADLANQQAVYMEQLAGMPAQQQLVQLGFMDNALSAQAMQLQMFALSGASQQAMDEVIGGAARADPVLRAMLESMGLISVGADGTITVTVGGQSELDQLTSSIEQLIMTEWIVMFNGDATKAEAAYEHATGLMVDWDGSEGTGTANLQDNASATLNNISSLLDSINGRVATNYVNTVYQVSGAGPVGAGFLASGALGGVFDGYADGGVVAEMNEYGLERLSFPGGGTGYTSGRRGLHRVPKGTLVTPASHVRAEGGTQPINVNIHVGGSIVGISDISQAVSRDIIPAIIQATNEWRERFPS